MGTQQNAKKMKGKEAGRRKAANIRREERFLQTATDVQRYQVLKQQVDEQGEGWIAILAATPLAFGLWLLYPGILMSLLPAAFVWWWLWRSPGGGQAFKSAIVPLALSWYATASYSPLWWRLGVVTVATMAIQIGALGLSVLFFVRCAVFNAPDLKSAGGSRRAQSLEQYEAHNAALLLHEPSREPFASGESDG